MATPRPDGDGEMGRRGGAARATSVYAMGERPSCSWARPRRGCAFRKGEGRPAAERPEADPAGTAECSDGEDAVFCPPAPRSQSLRYPATPFHWRSDRTVEEEKTSPRVLDVTCFPGAVAAADPAGIWRSAGDRAGRMVVSTGPSASTIMPARFSVSDQGCGFGCRAPAGSGFLLLMSGPLSRTPGIGVGQPIPRQSTT